METPEQYGSRLPHNMVSDAMEYTAEVLREIKSKCTKVGAVYRVSGVSQDTGRELTIVSEVTDDTAFPITETVLRNTLEACRGMINSDEQPSALSTTPSTHTSSVASTVAKKKTRASFRKTSTSSV